MNSIWKATTTAPHFPTQEGDVKTDVLIVGGGMAGILCAHMLEEAGASYVLVEADTVGGGVTGNTTAKITLQHGLLYDRLIRTVGTEKAHLYLDANRQALERYNALCNAVPCDFEKKDSFVYSVNDRKALEDELAALERLGCPVTFAERLPLPFSVAGAVRIPEQAQFHPLKFLYGIAKNLNILEHTKVLELSPDGARTNRGEIAAKSIIIATHFPILNKHGGYFLKLYQHRSYVLALEGAPDVDGMYVDEAQKGLSFRNHGNVLLLGGGSHRTGKKGGNWNELAGFARRHYPMAREVCRYAAQDCMSLDGIPYIGQYSKGTPDLYVATGFNKWGMTSSMVAAMMLTARILGKKTPYDALFSPDRSILHPQLLRNAGESLLGLLTPTAPRCPHLGCALHWNPHEHSWDCSCHGSRFAEDGQRIDNPATDDIKKPR